MAINGKKYSYESIKVTMSGQVLSECAGIDYKESENVEKTYVLGQKQPVAVTSGKREYEGNIMVTGAQYAELQKSIPRGASLSDIDPFEITVNYLDGDDNLMTDRLGQVKFSGVSKDFKSDGDFSVMTLPLSIGTIEYNI